MTRLVSSVLAVAIIALLLSPVGFLGSNGVSSSEGTMATAALPTPVLNGLVFPGPIDTSSPVPEYTMVSRALMLPGGSSDVVLDDLNDDGRTDLIVSVYEALAISIFYRQVDGTFKTYPSLNITTMYHPVSVRTVDIYASGHHQIVALEKNPAFSDTRLAIYNLTSETTYERWPDRFTYSNGIAFVVGEFSGDIYADLAVVCEGSNPQTTAGKLEVFFGPDFSTFELLTAGRGARSIAVADFDGDSELEIAVGNYYENNVMIFERPFQSGPSLTLAVGGMPTGITAGLLDGDSLEDLAVVSESSDAIHFYFQSLGSLPTVEDYSIAIPYGDCSVQAGDVNGDGRQDLLVLSQKANVSFGYYQGSSAPIWRDALEFVIPTSGVPRAAAIADLDGDGLIDLAVASSTHDRRGSALSLYPARMPTFSNSNSTTWTRSDVAASMLVTGDFDGDDIIDLILVNTEDWSLDFRPSFGPTSVTISLGFPPGKVVVADFNKDGCSDAAVTMLQGSSIVLLFGSNAFPDDPIVLSVAGSVTDIELGDFNHDSYVDFVVSTGEGGLDFFFNDQSVQAFGDPYEALQPGGTGIWAIASGDFNSDGLDDIAYTRSIRKIAILLQDPLIPFGPSSPTLSLSHSVGADFTSIWSGDLTGDGLDDIAAMRPFDSAVYLFDQEDFETAPHPYGTLALPGFPRFISVLDATDDGPADVIAIFEDADLLFLYRQHAGAFPASPSMVFLAGADARYATIGDGTQDHRGDLLVLSVGSHCVSIWQQNNFPPIARAGGPYFAREGSPLQFNGSAVTGTSEIPFMEYLWDFGDGNSTDWVRNARPVHTYLEIGNYSIALQVVDPGGLASADYSYVLVEDSYPMVKFSWSPTNISEGRLVTFIDETWSFDPIVSRNWYINGDYVSSESILNVSFQNGSQEISLEVIDSDGTRVVLTETIEVLSMAPELRIVGPSYADEGTAVEFVLLVDEWHGTPIDPIVSFEWDFAYVEGYFLSDPYAPNSAIVTHVFQTSSYVKVFRVAARATDSDGMTNLTTFDITIIDVGPSAGVLLSTDFPVEGIPFSFISSSTSFDGIVNWTWTLWHPNGTMTTMYYSDTEMANRKFELGNGSYAISLTVREEDGNSSVAILHFDVAEIPPEVEIIAGCDFDWPGHFEEFSDCCFRVNVTSYDPIVTYEWDFDAADGYFSADALTTIPQANHTYSQIGEYVVKVRVTDSDGSSSIAALRIEVKQKPFAGDFHTLVRVTRDPSDTSNVSFDISKLLTMYPDVIFASIDFGDGDSWTYDGTGPVTVYHNYVIGYDYGIALSVLDDDGYSYYVEQVVWNNPPYITLLSPQPHAVVRSGTLVLFLVSPGSTPLYNVYYTVGSSGAFSFDEMYRIDTSGWPTWNHTIRVIARDYGGNIARYETAIVIDDTNPYAVLSISRTKVYAGDKLNVSIMVDDKNTEASGITLYVRFQGETAYSTFGVSQGRGEFYHRMLDIPTREGSVHMYANITDKAGNSFITSVYEFTVGFRFIDRAWPYLLAVLGVATVAVPAYLLREHRIAVDEAFVIFRDGRLITHSTRRLKPGMDDHVLGGMLVAIQDFVKDSFKDVTSFALRRLDFGEKSVLIERGDNVFLAVVLHGQASRKVAVKMKKVVEEIESSFSKNLKDWDGDLDKLRGISDITKELYSRMPMFPGQTRPGS